MLTSSAEVQQATVSGNCPGSSEPPHLVTPPDWLEAKRVFDRALRLAPPDSPLHLRIARRREALERDIQRAERAEGSAYSH